MSNAIMFISFKLAAEVSALDFTKASEKMHREFISKQKGFISWKQLIDGDKWADLVTWETTDCAKNAMAASYNDAASGEFFALLDMESVNAQLYEVRSSF